MQVLCVSGRVAASSTAFVAAAAVTVGVLGASPAPTPHQLAAQLASAAHVAAGTVQQAETTLRQSLEATGPTVASLLSTSPALLSTITVHQLAAVATAPASTAPLIAQNALAGNAIPGLPTVNPADLSAVVEAVDELIGRFVQSFLTTPAAIAVAVGNIARGDVNGAFASLEGLVILPLVDFASSPYPQQAANAIARYLPSQLASAVVAAPTIFQFEGARAINLFTSARRSVVDAVQGFVSSLGTFNPVTIAGAIVSGLGNVVQTAVDNTFGANGGFAIAQDLIAKLFNAAFPDPGVSPTTAVARTALTTQAPSTTTTPAQSANGVTPSSSATLGVAESTRTTSATTGDVSAAPSVPVRAAAVATESNASAASASTPQHDSATSDDSAPAHVSADEAKSGAQPATTKTVDVTSGNKVQPTDSADASATPKSASVKESSNATATSPAKDSAATAKSDGDAGTAKTTPSSAGA